MSSKYGTSPYAQSSLVNITKENTYSYEAAIMALQLPNGEVLVNFNPSTKFSSLKPIADMIGAKIVTIHGTWTFVPTRQGKIDTEELNEQQA